MVSTNIEKKLSDLLASYTISTTIISTPLHLISQGTSYNERIGLQIKTHSLAFNFIFRAGAALVGTSVANMRVIVFQDLQQIDSTYPSGLDVLSTASPVSTRNWFNTSRFRILRDFNVTLDVYHTQKKLRLNIPINSVLKFSGSSSVNITRNGLYILFVSDNTANPPTLDFWSRLLYTDSWINTSNLVQGTKSQHLSTASGIVIQITSFVYAVVEQCKSTS